jgi:hypothetical protein
MLVGISGSLHDITSQTHRNAWGCRDTLPDCRCPRYASHGLRSRGPEPETVSETRWSLGPSPDVEMTD